MSIKDRAEALVWKSKREVEYIVIECYRALCLTGEGVHESNQRRGEMIEGMSDYKDRSCYRGTHGTEIRKSDQKIRKKCTRRRTEDSRCH